MLTLTRRDLKIARKFRPRSRPRRRLPGAETVPRYPRSRGPRAHFSASVLSCLQERQAQQRPIGPCFFNVPPLRVAVDLVSAARLIFAVLSRLPPMLSAFSSLHLHSHWTRTDGALLDRRLFCLFCLSGAESVPPLYRRSTDAGN
jgi:hypothetical protein